MHTVIETPAFLRRARECGIHDRERFARSGEGKRGGYRMVTPSMMMKPLSQRAKPGTRSEFPPLAAALNKQNHLAETSVRVPVVSLFCRPLIRQPAFSRERLPCLIESIIYTGVFKALSQR